MGTHFAPAKQCLSTMGEVVGAPHQTAMATGSAFRTTVSVTQGGLARIAIKKHVPKIAAGMAPATRLLALANAMMAILALIVAAKLSCAVSTASLTRPTKDIMCHHRGWRSATSGFAQVDFLTLLWRVGRSTPPTELKAAFSTKIRRLTGHAFAITGIASKPWSHRGLLCT